jgi:hypothetical protein
LARLSALCTPLVTFVVCAGGRSVRLTNFSAFTGNRLQGFAIAVASGDGLEATAVLFHELSFDLCQFGL